MKHAILTATAVILAACGGGDGGTSTTGAVEWVGGLFAAQACSDVWVEGADVADVDLEAPCVTDGGETTFFGSAVNDCVDGSTIGWNDLAWWGPDGVIHLHADDAAELVAPADVRDACLDG